MRIAPQSVKVGRFMVVAVNTATEDSHVLKYRNNFEEALQDAEERWRMNPNMGFIFLVLEVQGIASAQPFPSIQTKLTEKL